MSHEILPLSHCKFCKELAEDCECKRKGWRPDGWKLAGVEAAKPINLVPDDVRRMLSKDAYEQGASAMLSARDKEWVEWIETHTIIEQIQGYIGYHRIIPLNEWQSRRKEIGL